MKAVQINEHGGPETLKYQDVADLEPGPGDALLDMQAVGINYADVYSRAGNNPAAPLPRTIGMEGAGVIEQVGEAVEGLASGDRVSYCMVLGSYAHARIIAADRLITLDDRTSAEPAAAAPTAAAAVAGARDAAARQGMFRDSRRESRCRASLGLPTLAFIS